MAAPIDHLPNRANQAPTVQVAPAADNPRQPLTVAEILQFTPKQQHLLNALILWEKQSRRSTHWIVGDRDD
jgi:hypothetical protein